MFRMICISLIYIFIGISTPAWADDEQDIRDLITKANELGMKGDIAAIMSCFAPGYVMYTQRSADPNDIVVQINGSDEFRSMFEKNAQKTLPGIKLEILHVSIKGDKAVATTRYLIAGNTTPIPSQRNMLMVGKVDGKWLITSNITTVDLPSSGSTLTPTDSSAKTKTTEATVILGQIITLERANYKRNGSYVNFPAGANCPQIGFAAPTGSTRFTYSFQDSIATAAEKVDTNGDGAADDSLMLSVTNNMTVGAGTVGDPLSW
jgi:ketosteroid isomerase-like protein